MTKTGYRINIEMKAKKINGGGSLSGEMIPMSKLA
jgi:hypothetical protein